MLANKRRYEPINGEYIMKRIPWKEFQKSGMLWWINRIIHTFGMVIVFVEEDDGTISDVYPARCKFRGFNTKTEEEGFTNISKYMKDNAERLDQEVNR